MKRLILFMTLMLVFSWSGLGWAKPHIYKWVKDKNVSSDQVLREAQTSRVVDVSETETLALVREVMTEDLFMALAEYRKTKHLQEGETIKDTILPESIVGTQEVDLVDEDYRFLLEVRLKNVDGRTRVLAKASPVYRIRDLDREDERDNVNGESSSVEMKVKAPKGAIVDMRGGIYITPLEGLPIDYQINPLPDAQDRAQKLVRSFFYLLDQRLSKK